MQCTPADAAKGIADLGGASPATTGAAFTPALLDHERP
jgi:hypothetical protein